MEKDSVKKELFRFLKNKGAFNAFKYNFKKQTEKRMEWCKGYHSHFAKAPDESIESYIDSSEKPRTIFHFCFEWACTKEGHSYWEDLNKCWERKFNKH